MKEEISAPLARDEPGPLGTLHRTLERKAVKTHRRFQFIATPERRSMPKVPAKARLLRTGYTDPAQSEFVELLKSRDPSALTELVETYLPQLLRAAQGMGFSREEGEDLAQSVFAAFIEGVDRFEGRSHVRTFLFGIFYHKVSEHLRDLKRAQQFDPIDEEWETKFDAGVNWRQPPVDIEKQLFAKEADQIIRDCLEGIPKVQRIVFYLREVEEMTTGDICKNMGISRSNCGVLLFRARNRLRERLAKRGLANG